MMINSKRLGAMRKRCQLLEVAEEFKCPCWFGQCPIPDHGKLVDARLRNLLSVQEGDDYEELPPDSPFKDI